MSGARRACDFVDGFLLLLASSMCALAERYSGQYHHPQHFNQPALDSVDPCFFPAPDQLELGALCRYNYHQLAFLCDPQALLSRTEADALEQSFPRVALTGCLQCRKSPRYGCVADNPGNMVRISILLVPLTNVQKVESCVLGHSNRGRLGKREAITAYADFVYRRWAEHSCAADITILYVRSLQNVARSGVHSSSGPLIVRLFRNRLSHLSYAPNIRQLTVNQPLLQVLREELNETFHMARVEERFQKPGQQKTKHIGGVPYWALQICGVLIVLVIITFYLGNCLTRRLSLRAQQKKSQYNRQGQQGGQQTSGGGGGSGERWRAGFGGGLISQGNSAAQGGQPSAMSNMAVQNTKSSMMFRQFSTGNSKKAKAARAAGIQKI